eukprot:SAG11_NODE_4162_length_2030_cov_2.937338_2_plen_249_part_01
MKQLRSVTAILLRLRTHGRCGDIAVINRFFSDDPPPTNKLAGLFGSAARQIISKVRYDFPKTWRSRSGRFSAWKDLGGYLRDVPGYHSSLALCCVRSAVESYWARTWDLNLAPLHDPRRPNEVVYRFFVSLVPRCGHYFPCVASTLSSDMKEVLHEECGIDTDCFKPHVLRSASIAARRETSDEDLSLFYPQPRCCIRQSVLSFLRSSDLYLRGFSGSIAVLSIGHCCASFLCGGCSTSQTAPFASRG